MIIETKPQLKNLAAKLNSPLYLVGGNVRNALLGIDGGDTDICAAILPEEFQSAAESCGFVIAAYYKRTGTIKLKGKDGLECEYSPLRSDIYSGGKHHPDSVEFTADLLCDAKRRDFTVNAIYYDISKGELIDPLGGIGDIKQRKLRVCAHNTFEADGLRLMRLVRFAAQLGFFIERDTLYSARKNSGHINDISAERIYAELTLILNADSKYPDKKHSATAHFRGLQLLYYTDILRHILPEVYACRGVLQPPAYHVYDVLMHSFMATTYADSDVRLAALLHDIGKAETYAKSGNFLQHDIVGARTARRVLRRLKAPKALTREILFLIDNHMYDGDGKTSEKKLRLFIVNNYQYIDKLLKLMRADALATGKFSDADWAEKKHKWTELMQRMRADGTPFTLSGLKLGGKQIIELGASGRQISQTLQYLWRLCIVNPSLNTFEELQKQAQGFLKGLAKQKQDI